MQDELMESPRPAPRPPLWRRPLGCAVALALIAGVVVLCAVGSALTRTWPPSAFRLSAPPYSIQVAPDNLLSPWSSDPPITRMNEAGQILVSGAVRTMLWTPTRAGGASAVVDFNTLLGATDPETTRVRASALNAFGQVAGVVEQSLSGGALRDTVFLWTPQQLHGAVGELTLVTPPPPKNTSYRWYGAVQGVNDYGQVAFNWGDTGVLWTPEAPNGTRGSSVSIQPDNRGGKVELDGVNGYGQVAGQSNGRAFIWTPTQAHATTGRLTRIPKPSSSVGIHFFALSTRGAFVGVAIDVFRLSGLTNDAIAWLPDAPNSSVGHLQTLGALGWNEDGAAYDINATGTALGDSCFRVRRGSDFPCQQLRYFVWDQRHGMTDLQTLLDPGSGYTIQGVKAMNDAGQIVVLGKSSPDTYRLLLLTPRSGGAV